MIRFLCEHCGKKLSADEAKAGKVGRCPACQQTFRIPDMERAEEPEAPAPAEAIQTRRAEPPLPRRRPKLDEEDGSPREELQSRKRRRKRKQTSGVFELPFGLSPLLFGLIVVYAIGVICLIPALFVPAIAVVPILLGYLVMGVGGVWFLVVAFQDEVMHGVLCLLCNLYSLYYLIINFEEEKWPFAVQIAGILLAVAGMCAGGGLGKDAP
jgi:hypothetical protein